MTTNDPGVNPNPGKIRTAWNWLKGRLPDSASIGVVKDLVEICALLLGAIWVVTDWWYTNRFAPEDLDPTIAARVESEFAGCVDDMLAFRLRTRLENVGAHRAVIYNGYQIVQGSSLRVVTNESRTDHIREQNARFNGNAMSSAARRSTPVYLSTRVTDPRNLSIDLLTPSPGYQLDHGEVFSQQSMVYLLRTTDVRHVLTRTVFFVGKANRGEPVGVRVHLSGALGRRPESGPPIVRVLWSENNGSWLDSTNEAHVSQIDDLMERTNSGRYTAPTSFAITNAHRNCESSNTRAHTGDVASD